MWHFWTLEVTEFFPNVQYGDDGETWKERHVGYIQGHFRSKKDAADYYDRHNPHMRKLNAFNDWRSDWDPKTHLRYIVRKAYNLRQTVPPFPE